MINDQQLKEIAKSFSVEFASARAFFEVESGGIGFDRKTGKIIIQFEPGYFKRLAPESYKNYLWLYDQVRAGKAISVENKALYDKYQIIFNNKVEGQTKEWVAFNLAFRINPIAAMRSTSIGIGQVMGDNFSALRYKSVGDMWDDAKRGEYQQVLQMFRFIKSKPALFKALSERNWHLVAYNYNGSGYKALAKRLNREPYDISLQKAYLKFKSN